MTPADRVRRPDARARILTAATTIFLRDGFAVASVDAVAAAARMSKLSIYELFPSKDALFEAAVRHAFGAGYQPPPRDKMGGDLANALRDIGIWFFERFIDPTNFGLFRANIVAANHFPDLASELHLHRLRASQTIADDLRAWVDRGELHTSDTWVAALRFGGLCVEGSRYFLGTAPPSGKTRAAIVARATTLFLNGYAAAGTGAFVDVEPVAAPTLPGTAASRMSPDRLAALLHAATDEFLANGYRSANIDRIVGAVRASRATVYRQFGSKEGLFRFVVEQAAYDAAQELYAIAPGQDPEEETAALALEVLDRHCTTDNIRLQRLLIQEADLIPDLARHYYDAKIARIGKALAAIFERHRLPLPDPAMSRAFHALATFALRYLTDAALPDVAQRRREARDATHLFLHGVRAR
ncbi:TetR/AcrR family transcriptional regulator C-terminal domain-containing protein [Sphingomonas lycopersici]|uniref:TetR/AcrR family transcriptional regulator C-terminal domain-containing protein n=1 Tax=Sphingomonas lycopersici TaxID=2951807 RepID=A0AA42CRT2_9SPHN|nr:TetR/AcrR family transcriptional regulator C-terminal domain-containing protein [Sphingomonas lycopersici]MCW6536462.1 TetR/AcrR family transcriptional regulator C-terminal domain-containing protein [Sphingomonas lycopersici]